MAVTAKMVKELRDMTSAGMMDCKKALVEADGDMDRAVEILREKGLSKAAKKAGRIAAMGLVRTAFSEDGKTAAIVEVNSETDFVAKNAEFIGFVEKLAELALNAESNDMDAFKAIALGAKGVCIGRPLMSAYTNDRKDGVFDYLTKTRGELAKAMAFTGCTNLNRMDPSVIHRDCFIG